MPHRLEELTPDAQVTGLIGREAVRIVSAQLLGEACDVVYRDGQGNLHSQILFRDKEADLELVASGRKWSFLGDGDKFRLVSEGERIRLAYLLTRSSGSAAAPSTHCPIRSPRSKSTCCQNCTHVCTCLS